MIIDSSVIVEIALGNQGYEKYLDAITEAPGRFMSAVNLYETAVVVFKKRGTTEAITSLYALLKMLKVEIIAFDLPQANSAAAVYTVFGKGFHPAQLNLGDCPAYALAKSRKLPLLFKGDDFSKTDIRSVSVF
jgi:ribonuclease VapC